VWDPSSALHQVRRPVAKAARPPLGQFRETPVASGSGFRVILGDATDVSHTVSHWRPTLLMNLNIFNLVA
jgi:hypothetical protein